MAYGIMELCIKMHIFIAKDSNTQEKFSIIIYKNTVFNILIDLMDTIYSKI